MEVEIMKMMWNSRKKNLQKDKIIPPSYKEVKFHIQEECLASVHKVRLLAHVHQVWTIQVPYAVEDKDKGVHEARFLAHVHQVRTIQVPFAVEDKEDKDKGVHEARFPAHVHQVWTIQVPYAVEKEEADNKEFLQKNKVLDLRMWFTVIILILKKNKMKSFKVSKSK